MSIPPSAHVMEEAARAAVPLFDLGSGEGLEFVTHRENCVFRLQNGEQEVAVRVHRPGYRTREELDSEMEYMAGLHDLGFPVPRFVVSRSGERVHSVTTANGTQCHVSVQEWITNDGSLGDVGSGFDGTSTLVPEDFRLIGQSAARLHSLGGTVVRSARYRRADWDFEGIAGVTALLGDPFSLSSLSIGDLSVIEEAAGHLRALLVELGTDSDHYGPIHGDLTPENFLHTPGGLMVIDFDDLGDGWHLFDIATTAFWFLPHPRYGEYVEALLSGYREHKPIPPERVADFDAFVFARGLTYLGWAASRNELPLADFICEEVVPIVIELARNFVTRRNGSTFDALQREAV